MAWDIVFGGFGWYGQGDYKTYLDGAQWTGSGVLQQTGSETVH